MRDSAAAEGEEQAQKKARDVPAQQRDKGAEKQVVNENPLLTLITFPEASCSISKRSPLIRKPKISAIPTASAMIITIPLLNINAVYLLSVHP